MANSFIKWAGGKRQLITTLDSRLPDNFDKQITKYVEPFVGGGSYLFHMVEKHPKLKRVVINDVNYRLINCYTIIRDHPKELNNKMKLLADLYNTIDSDEDKKEMYNLIRKQFNQDEGDELELASYFIFLNKTCFNGLYRVNSRGEFNVPFGKYAHPNLFDENRINSCSELLQKAKIVTGDFDRLVNEATKHAFFYLDPPYRPISKTSSFTEYDKTPFKDEDQIRVKEFCDAIDDKESYFLLSNSDCQDDFFEKLYEEYYVEKIKARRNINSRGEARGYILEILVSNYKN